MNSVQGGSRPDRVTILVSKTRAQMTKVIGPGETVISTAKLGMEFLVDERQVCDLAGYYALLLELASQSDRAIIRDVLKHGLSYDTPHRRNGRTFDKVPHRWLMVDCDDIEAPPEMSPTDPYAVEWMIQNRFPAEFHDCSYIIQFSSSAGTAKAGRNIKVHLWFMLATPTHSDALVSWAKIHGFDPAVYHAVQVHYTANPIFQGCADPLQGPRVLFVQKAQEAVALVLPDAPRGPFKAPTAAPAAAVVGEGGTLLEGREGWLLRHNLAQVRARLAAGLALDAERMTAETCEAFNAKCCNLDGSWPASRIAEKVAATIRRAMAGEIPGLPRLGLQPHWKLFPEPIADIRASLSRQVASFFGPGMEDVLALAYPPGTGKTRAVAEEAVAAAMRGERTAFYLPTVALAVEVASKMLPYARVIRGRDQRDPNIAGQRMCQRAETARAVGEAGYSVGRTLCPECPFKKGCSYQAQFQSPPPIPIFSHAHLTLPRRAGWVPDRAVIDEASWQVCIEVRELAFADFLKAYPPGFEPALMAALVDGFRHGDVLARLYALPDHAALLDAASRLAFKDTRRITFGPTASVADVQRRVGGKRNAALFALILRSMAAEMASAPGRASSHTVRLVGDILRCSFLKRLCALDGVDKVLVIDAQADEGIIRRVMQGRIVQYERKDATRNADIIQVPSSVNGTSRLKRNTALVDKVARFAEWNGTEGAWLGPADTQLKTVMFVAKDIRHQITGEPENKGTLPVSVPFGAIDVAHYGNVKGSNTLEGHHSAVLLGRPQRPASAIEELSGLFMHDADPLLFTNSYVRQDRGYCHPGGRGASVWVHPDPRFQSLLEQSREWECIQALDRLRLYGPIRKTVVLLTDLVLPISVSRFASEEEIVPTWRDLAVQNGGLILDSPAWLAKTFPTRFASAAAAKEWVRVKWGTAPAIQETPVLPNAAACTPDALTATVVHHRPKPTRSRGRGNGFKRALHVGNPGSIPADLDKATGKATEFVAYIGGFMLMTNVSFVREPEGE